jgi:hypothetical protein
MGLAGNRIGASRRRFGTSVLVRSDDMAGGGLGKPGRGNPTTGRASVPVRFGGRSDGNKECVSAVTRCIGNGVLRKAVAPARCFGIEGHVGNRVHGFETLGHRDDRASGGSGGQKVRRRRSCWPRGFASAGPRSGGARLRSGLEQGTDGFGCLVSPTGAGVRAQSRREAQGSNGRTSRGNAAGEQRTSGGETPEVGATFEERYRFRPALQDRRGPTTRGAGHSVYGPAMAR